MMPDLEKAKLKPSEFRLGFLVHDVSRFRRTIIDNALKPYGITRSQWWVLANLSRHADQPTTQSELACLLEIGRVTLCGLLYRLELAGHIERQVTKTDRRAKMVRMTQKGRSLLSEIESLAHGLNQDTVLGIADEEILECQEMLSKMKQRLIEMNNNFNKAARKRAGQKFVEAKYLSNHEIISREFLNERETAENQMV